MIYDNVDDSKSTFTGKGKNDRIPDGYIMVDDEGRSRLYTHQMRVNGVYFNTLFIPNEETYMEMVKFSLKQFNEIPMPY
jgi:hypothetical protein